MLNVVLFYTLFVESAFFQFDKCSYLFNITYGLLNMLINIL